MIEMIIAITRRSFVFAPSVVLLSLLLVSSTLTIVSASNAVFDVKYKYAGRERSLSALIAHDSRRQLRILAGVDLPLGGTGRPDGVGLYYAKIGIGTPSKDYYLQVDTGTDTMWVNCIDCRDCPKKSSLGIELTLYDIEDSTTGKVVPCDSKFCIDATGGSVPGCTANMSCPYFELYGDGSSTNGYFVNDVVKYDWVSGDLNTTSANGTIIFGCGASLSGGLDSSDDALDGILGFGKSNSSVISQLAMSGKVKKMFAHCLDGINGGGIFAIGHVVQPNVNTTPLVPNHRHCLSTSLQLWHAMFDTLEHERTANWHVRTRTRYSRGYGGTRQHYSVNMTAVEVGREFLKLPRDVFEVGDNKGAIIDSGTTLAYLPEVVYVPLVNKIISQQPDLKVQTVHDQYTCFHYSESLDDGFPNVTFHFENSLYLKVLPHEYLFPMDDLWCMGWQNSGNRSRYTKDVTLLGDLVLSNKLVFYDLENEVIGWTDYNCSSSIKVKDEQTGTVHLVGSHYLPSGCNMNTQTTIILLLLITLLHISLY